MKKTIISIFGIVYLSLSTLNAQNIEPAGKLEILVKAIDKLNKKELRDYIITLSDSIYLIETENLKLLNSQNELSANSKILENEITLNNAEIENLKEEIENLNVLLKQSKTDMSFLQSQNEHTVDKLNEEISTLSDSIFNIKASIESDSTVVKLNEEISTLRDSIFNIKASFSQDSKTADKNDFLNNYFFDQIPLPNNSFQLVLSKIIFGNSHVDGHYAHNSVLSIPEILDAKAFHYWTAKTDVVITSNSNFKDYLVLKNEEYFDSKLPQIEILKNKLFTILYNDGSEESFLFNVNEPEDPNQYNNQRKIIQINLANEEVKDNASNDIVWRIFPIDNECYLALTYLQLNRLKLHLKSSVDGLEVYWEDYGKRSFDQSDFAYQNQKNNTVTTTGNGIYLSRDKDSYMDTSSYINPENLIFLIKLK